MSAHRESSETLAQIVVLNDRQYFSELDGCQIVTVSGDLSQYSYADEIPEEQIVSRVVLSSGHYAAEVTP